MWFGWRASLWASLIEMLISSSPSRLPVRVRTSRMLLVSATSEEMASRTSTSSTGDILPLEIAAIASAHSFTAFMPFSSSEPSSRMK